MNKIARITAAAVGLATIATAAPVVAASASGAPAQPAGSVIYRVNAVYCGANADGVRRDWRQFRSLSLASATEIRFVADQAGAPGTLRRVDLIRVHVRAPIAQHVISKSVRSCAP